MRHNFKGAAMQTNTQQQTTKPEPTPERKAFESLIHALSAYCEVNEVYLWAVLCRLIYFAPKEKFFALLNTDSLIVVAKQTNFLNMLRHKVISSDFIIKFHKETDSKELAKDIKSITALIQDFLTIYRYIDDIEEKSTPFAERITIEKVKNIAKINYPFDFYNLKRVFEAKIKSSNYKANIASYKAHFPQLDSVLSFVVAGIFAKVRKQSYLWIKAPSDWGKTFLFTIFQELGMLIKVSVEEIKKAFTGNPLGLNPAKFRNKFILAFEEFNATADQLKQLENEIFISPKFGFRQSVAVHTKIMISADSVTSLVTENGIEDQFANRLSFLEYFNKLQLSADRKDEFFSDVCFYVASTVIEELKRYKAVTAEERPKQASIVIGQFFDDYKIEKAFGRLSDNLQSVAQEFIHFCLYRDSPPANTPTPNSPDAPNFEYAFIYNNLIHIVSPVKAFEEFIKLKIPQDEQRFLKGKNINIFKMMQCYDDQAKDIPFNQVITVNQKRIRCLRVNQSFVNMSEESFTTPQTTFPDQSFHSYKKH